MKTAQFIQELRSAARETPRLYFSTVLDIARIFKKPSDAKPEVKTNSNAKERPRVVYVQKVRGRSLATSLGSKRDQAKTTQGA